MTTTPTGPDPRDELTAVAVSTREIDSQSKGRRRLSVTVVNFWLDAMLLFLLFVQGLLSAILQFVFPDPTIADGWTLWGLTYDQWHDVQFGSLCLLAFGVLIHVMMHWNWVCSVIATQIVRTRGRPDEAMQTIYGVATLIVILHVIAAGVIAAMLCVRRPPL
ncbi:MAG: DUF4405 domain-containing protein [Isosphaerales bacterium]